MAAHLSHPHVVRPGETLSKIAQRYGIHDWRALYDAPWNAGLRRKRPDPNSVRPGDVVNIPPRPVETALVLQQRLATLQQLRKESVATFDKLTQEVESQGDKVGRVGKTVDATAEVSQIFVALGSLVKEGFEAMHLTGKALDEANTKLAKSAVKEAYKPVAEKPAEAWAEHQTPDDGLLWGFGKVLLQSWFDMQKPSFWAGTVANLRSGQSWSTAVTRRPEDILADAKGKIAAQRKQTLDALDRKIDETQQQLRHSTSGRTMYTRP